MQGKYMCVHNGVSFIKKMKNVSFVEKKRTEEKSSF